MHIIGLLHKRYGKVKLNTKHIHKLIPYFDRIRLCFNECHKNMLMSLAVVKIIKVVMYLYVHNILRVLFCDTYSNL